MKSGAPKLTNHFFLPEDQRLFDYDQIFSVSAMWAELGMQDTMATYDLFVRGMPKNRNFLLFGGLEEILESIVAWRYTKSEVDYLLEHEIITLALAKLLRTYRFSGDIWAMKEGTVFFPGEPVVRLTGRIWEINLFTFFLINALTSNTIFFSKIVRNFLAANEKIKFMTCSVTRAHANEASLKFGRAAYILGAPSAIVPGFARKFNLPISKANTKAYHAFIKSFPHEIDAMRAATSVFPYIGIMVDTYDVKQGIKNFITVAKELQSRNEKIRALVIDSGRDVVHYAEQARYARHELDAAGLPDVGIQLAGNFEEMRIAELVRLKAPVDSIVACTDLITSSDDPKLEAVLKLAEFTRGKKTHSSAKLTPGKESYPGKKQVYRAYQKGCMTGDTLALAGELLGTPLLKKMVSQGKLVYRLPTLDELRVYTKKQLATLPPRLRRVDRQFTYPFVISPKLRTAFLEAKRQHLDA